MVILWIWSTNFIIFSSQIIKMHYYSPPSKILSLKCIENTLGDTISTAWSYNRTKIDAFLFIVDMHDIDLYLCLIVKILGYESRWKKWI